MAAHVTSPPKFNVMKKRGSRIVVDDDDDLISPTDLSEMLAEGTRESHNRSIQHPFVKDYLGGHIKKELFERGTAALYFIYSAMEEELEKNRDHPHIAPIYFPKELHRHEALARDLKYFYGKDWESQITLSGSTKLYVDRIHEVGQTDPILLLAHSYSHYMGDLSGGHILKKVAQKALKLPSTGEGLTFYQFEGIHNHNDFKKLFRSRMNELELDTETKQKLVEEAIRAFGFNIMVFSELHEFGKTIKEEVQDAAASGDPTNTNQPAVMLFQHPLFLMALVACVAVLAAWYIM